MNRELAQPLRLTNVESRHLRWAHWLPTVNDRTRNAQASRKETSCCQICT